MTGGRHGRMATRTVFALVFLASVGPGTTLAQSGTTSDLGAGAVLGGATLGLGVGAATGIAVELLQANVWGTHYQGGFSPGAVVAELSPWLIAGTQAGVVRVGMLDHASGPAWRGVGRGALAGLVTGAIVGGASGLLGDGQGGRTSTLWDGLLVGSVVGAGMGSLAAFVTSTTESGVNGWQAGLLGGVGAIPLFFEWRH